MKFLQDLYITQSDRMMLEKGFGIVKVNKLNLSEGDRNDIIVEKVSKYCVMGQYPHKDTNLRNWEIWYWGNPNCKHCTLTFNKELSSQRIDELINIIIEICGPNTGPETWIDYTVVYDKKALNLAAKKFQEANIDNLIPYNGKQCTIIPYNISPDDNHSFLKPIRNRKNGYVLNSLELVKLAVSLGFF